MYIIILYLRLEFEMLIDFAPAIWYNKVYKDRHFGYNFWKWALSRFKSQKDIFTKEEKIQIFEMMKSEFEYNKSTNN